ncbi:GNAT family N-acetyltransferase [Pseudalkalibacillus caeni]|uniref:GNAT family N-acetyltransferase n=1 Tax=Exobacillus caeni TaxID=2574798 RepID=A0A5R9F6J7_9BACL|nr:GNAT family N-acetyltransferase [Pseudalkalibacillus caeni]TLS36114.1 GNAT family N-acetyltransferase [Pseudalkalibacillus caeni]
MVELLKMTEEDYQHFLDYAIEDYAKEKTKAGNYEEHEAIERSKQDFGKLLPEGLETENHLLHTIVDQKANKKVGYLWTFLDKKPNTAFIYNIWVFDELQGKGYGSKAIAKLEELLKEKGIEKLELHVFGHNQGAFRLYQRLGFEPTNIVMAKTL